MPLNILQLLNLQLNNGIYLNKKKNILVLTFWSFNDPLIQSYTLPYVKIMHSKLREGSKVYVQTLEQSYYKGDAEETRKVIESLKNDGIEIVLRPYYPLGLKAIISNFFTLLILSKIILIHRINFIHGWCTTAGLLAWFLSKMWRRPLILDSYEPHAEAMVENGSWKEDSIPFKFLFWLEGLETKRAKHIIGTTQGMLKYAEDKYKVAIDSFLVKPACVNVSQFDYSKRKDQNLLESLDLEGKITLLYAGKFGGIYFDKEVFDFIKVASDYFGEGHFRVLILSNLPENQLLKYCEEANVNSSIIRLRFVQHSVIQDYMNLADFAICPVKPVPSKKYCTPVKNGEYWSMGLPVVIPKDISDDSEIIEKHNIGYVWKEMNHSEYLRSCEYIAELLKDDQINKRVREVAMTYRDFSIAEKVYEEIYG